MADEREIRRRWMAEKQKRVGPGLLATKLRAQLMKMLTKRDWTRVGGRETAARPEGLARGMELECGSGGGEDRNHWGGARNR